jgi:hypothetical protein
LQLRLRQQKKPGQCAEAAPLLQNRSPPNRSPTITRLKTTRRKISRLKNGLRHLPKLVPDHPAEAVVDAAVVGAVAADANKPSLRLLPQPQ